MNQSLIDIILHKLASESGTTIEQYKKNLESESIEQKCNEYITTKKLRMIRLIKDQSDEEIFNS